MTGNVAEARRKLAMLARLVESNEPDEVAALEIIEDDLKQIAEHHRNEEWSYRHQALNKQEEQERAERLGNAGAAETASHDKYDCERRAEIHRYAAEQADAIAAALQEDPEQKTA